MSLRNRFSRAVDVPGPVLERARLARGQKVLAGTVARDGSWLLGTRDELVVVPADPATAETRVPWQQVERADWDRDEERVRVVEVGRFGLARPSYTFEVEDPGLLLELVRERVTASVVLQRRVVTDGKLGLFVIARRPPRGPGEITWAYEFDAGVDPDDPAVMQAAERGLAVAAEELGL